MIKPLHIHSMKGEASVKIYNEELKNRFVKHYAMDSVISQQCRRVFGLTGKYEAEWEADICSRDAADIQIVVDMILDKVNKTKWTYVSILKAYIQWCYVNNIDKSKNGFMGVTLEALEPYRLKYVSSPTHLQRVMNQVLHAEDLHSTDYIYRAAFWLAFSGLSNDDIVEITSDAIDIQSMNINWKGISYPIYKEARAVLEYVATSDVFTYIHSNYTTQRKRVAGNAIIRGVRSDRSDADAFVHDFITQIRRRGLADKGEVKLSFADVRFSGNCYRLYQDELRGIPISFYNEYIESVVGISKSQNAAYVKMQGFHEKYNLWKLLFSL